MQRVLRTVGAVWLVVVLLPTIAAAQASIAGVVKDASGAVLPGVTVEATSPALLEKSRSVITDGSGLYKIVDLRPGTYSVTFTLTGFSTVKRDGVELTGSFTATINADLRVGGVTETIVVTGESPIVDIQSVTQERVLGKDVIDAIPTSNTHFSVATLIPAVQSSNTADVGGTNAISLVSLTAHGGRNTDMRVMLDGLTTNNTEGAGQFSGYLPNMSSTHEVAVDIAAGMAERGTGGVFVNIVPRDGGNRVSGNFFGSGANESMEANNLTADIIARGLTTPTNLKMVADLNGGVGGPILKDRNWFFVAARKEWHNNYSGGYTNLNAGNPGSWSYAQGTPTTNDGVQRSANVRLTWQVSPRNKVSYFYDNQYRCLCLRNLTPLLTPEATSSIEYPYANIHSITWSSPVTSRLLFEAGFLWHPENWHYKLHDLDMIGVVDQGLGNLTYRGQIQVNSNGQFPDAHEDAFNFRAAVSYVTGSHAIKVGFNDQYGSRDISTIGNNYNLSYRFNSVTLTGGAAPNQLTEYSTPNRLAENIKADLGIYAQDRWTLGRMTANLGLRFDYFNDYFPAQTLGPSLYTPNRNLSFPQTPWVAWKDFTPRMGLVYDVFGNGKTALKVSLNKYMLAYGLQGMFGDGSNPVNLTTTSVTRSWTDANKNFVPDCDLTSPLKNGECGAMSSALFGQSIPSASVDPDILTGWGKRGFNWEFSAGVQHEIAPRVSVDLSFFRRWYGNFIAIDNTATSLSDYTPFSITAPLDSRLPGGGGYTVNGLYDVSAAKFSTVSNYYTFASNYGEMYEHWNGVDFGVNARVARGVFLNGGFSTGRTVTDNCGVLAVAPEAITGTTATGSTTTVALATTPSALPYCHADTTFLTQGRLSASYLVPVVGIQASANFQSLPGPAISANYVAANAAVSPSLGRPLSGGAANVTVNLVAPGQMYGDRVNQLDFRFSKAVQFSGVKTAFNVDIFNVGNANPVLTLNNAFSSWLTPLSILQSRFVKFGVQVDF